jgi:hypothetical protein
MIYHRVIRKVRKTQQQNPEFGHQVRFLKNLQKSTLALRGWVRLRTPSNFVVN